MSIEAEKSPSQWNKYKISRISRKLSVVDEFRLLSSLSQDLSERSWSEIFNKEDTDMVIFEVREQLVQESMNQIFAQEPRDQRARFAVDCAAAAALQLIDWYFYRHDGGEDATALPACHVPRRAESWLAEAPPAPSPADCWARHALPVRELITHDPCRAWPSADSLDYPEVDDIPREFWFPGKIKWPKSEGESFIIYGDSHSGFSSSSGWSGPSVGDLAASSELVQRVTDYTDTSLPLSPRHSLRAVRRVPSAALIVGEAWSRACETEPPPPAPPAPPAPAPPPPAKPNRSLSVRSARRSRSEAPRAPPPARLSDCRLRPLRLETQYEVTSEKIESKPGKPDKKKKK